MLVIPIEINKSERQIDTEHPNRWIKAHLQKRHVELLRSRKMIQSRNALYDLDRKKHVV